MPQEVQLSSNGGGSSTDWMTPTNKHFIKDSCAMKCMLQDGSAMSLPMLRFYGSRNTLIFARDKTGVSVIKQITITEACLTASGLLNSHTSIITYQGKKKFCTVFLY